MKKRLTLLLVLTSLGWPMLAAADVPDLIRYQGQLTDAQGAPLDGPYDLIFRLYDAATGGAVLWTEPHEDVVMTGGQFSVLLGSVNSLASEDWSQPRWLSIQVNTDPELSPRQQITSVSLAVRAGTAEALATPVTTSNITDDAHALVPAGAVILWTGASCPTGYTRLSALDGRFLVGSSSYNSAAGGSNTKNLNHMHSTPAHSHDSVGHFHTYYSDGSSDFRNTSPPAGTTYVNSGGGGAGTTGQPNPDLSTIDIRPMFANVLLCQRD